MSWFKKFSLHDIANFINPMVIKELRQELRVRTLENTFILMHAVMLISIIFGVLTTSYGNSSVVSGTYWFALAISVLWIMPGRGAASFTREVDAESLELLQITRLSSSQIITGKWLAIILETSLIVISLLPYVSLLYYIEKANLLNVIIVTYIIFFISLLLTSLRIVQAASSRKKAKWGFRIIFIILAIVLFQYLGSFLFYSGSKIKVDIYLIYLSIAVGLPFIMFFLEMGASKIAPATENHSGLQRFYGLLTLIGGFLILLSEPKFDGIVFSCLLAILVVIFIQVLSEQPKWHLGIYHTFAKRGFFARIIGKFFYPGWQSGLLYLLFILGLLWFLIFLFNAYGISISIKPNIQFAALLISVFGGLILPVVPIQLFLPEYKTKFTLYLMLQVLFMVIPIAYFILSSSNLFNDASIFPAYNIFVLLDRSSRAGDIVFLSLPLTILALIILLPSLTKTIKKMNLLEKQSISKNNG